MQNLADNLHFGCLEGQRERILLICHRTGTGGESVLFQADGYFLTLGLVLCINFIATQNLVKIQRLETEGNPDHSVRMMPSPLENPLIRKNFATQGLKLDLSIKFTFARRPFIILPIGNLTAGRNLLRCEFQQYTISDAFQEAIGLSGIFG